MDLADRISHIFEDSAQIKLQVKDALAKPIAEAAHRMVACLMRDGKILSCGNGGSAADAQQFTAKLLNQFETERPGLAAIALTANNSVITAIANDHDFSQIFSRQVRTLGMAGDVLLVISTSGNSMNVVEAIFAAHERGMEVIALTGREGGAVGEMLRAEDIHICVNTQSIARIQEVQLVALHCLCDSIDYLLMGGG